MAAWVHESNGDNGEKFDFTLGNFLRERITEKGTELLAAGIRDHHIDSNVTHSLQPCSEHFLYRSVLWSEM